MLGHSQETIQVLRQLERLSPLFWGSGRSAATGISRSGSSQARPKEEGPKRPSGWLSRGVASLTLTSVPQPGTVMDSVSASGILAAVQSQWDTFPRYCHATKTFASRSGSRRVGTTSLKISSPLPIGLDYLLCWLLALDTAALASWCSGPGGWSASLLPWTPDHTLEIEETLGHLALVSDRLLWKSELANLSRQEKGGRAQHPSICPGRGCTLHPGQAVHRGADCVASSMRPLEEGKEEIQKSEFLPKQGILKEHDRCLDGCSQILQGSLHVQRVEIHEPSRSSSFTRILWMELVPPVYPPEAAVGLQFLTSQFSSDSRCSGRS